MQINGSNEQHHDARKQSLIQQILSYKRRIIEYQQLQKELQTLSSTINQSQTLLSTRDLTKSPSIINKSPSLANKSLSNSQKKLTPESINVQTANNGNKPRLSIQPRRYSSSSKKIKAYELQKKLSRLSKEHNDKFAEFLGIKRENQVIEETIQQLKNIITKQVNRTQELQQQSTNLNDELEHQHQEQISTKKQLQKVVEKKQLYLFQKSSLIDKINSTKLKLSQVQSALNSPQFLNPLQPNILSLFNANLTTSHLSNRETQRTIEDNHHQDNQYQMSESMKSYEQQHFRQGHNIKRLNFEGIEYDIIQSNSYLSSLNESHLSPNNRIRQTTVPQSNDFRELNFKDEINTKKSSKNTHTKSLTNQSCNVFPLKDQLQLISQHNHQLNESIFQLQNHILKITTQIKHHQLNIVLIRKKTQNHQRFITREHINYLKNLENTEVLRKQLSVKQGQRGQIRGKIGIKVQESALIKTLNLTINKDLNHLKDKLNSLILYKNVLCGQLIGKNHLLKSKR